MVVDEQVDRRHDEDEGIERLWCYLVVLRGRLCAIPDEEHTVLMPHINRLAAVTPLPLGLVPAYVLGLINVGRNGEVVVDLGVYLLTADHGRADSYGDLFNTIYNNVIRTANGIAVVTPDQQTSRDALTAAFYQNMQTAWSNQPGIEGGYLFDANG